MEVPVPQSKIHAQDIVDPGPGEHLWIMAACFKVPDAVVEIMKRGDDPGPQLLDHENLMSIEGPGCYKCEQSFDTRMVYRKCKGTLDLMPES